MDLAQMATEIGLASIIVTYVEKRITDKHSIVPGSLIKEDGKVVDPGV